LSIKLITGGGISKKGIKLLLDTEKIGYNGKIEVFSDKNIKIITNPLFLNHKNCKEYGITKFKIVKTSAKLNTRFGMLGLPLQQLCEVKADKAEILNYFSLDGKKIPAVVRKGENVCFLFDIGKVFHLLLTQKYYEKEKEARSLSNPFIRGLYKKIPYSIRIILYNIYYKRLHNKLAKLKGFVTDYPIDKSGYAILDLFESTLKGSVKILRWPPGFDYACVISHDAEPTKSSYKEGMAAIARAAGDRKTTMCVVGKYFRDYGKPINKDFASHGWVHDMNFSRISRDKRLKRILMSKTAIEKKIRRRVIGFRAPTLQITDDLYSLLKKAGFEYDMSHMDSQREIPNTGRGVSINLPYFINGILEIPTAAPDCITPSYFGYSMKETLGLFSQKIAWIEKTGQLANFIVHAPVWGRRDAEKRILLLDHIIKNTKKKKCFCTDCNGLYEWWKKRNNILIKNEKIIVNKNNQDIEIAVSRDGRKKTVFLKKNQKIKINF
jgi:peptidoglycan/xylan/chitin deacetylase (PgdA/CDA1 family)